MNLGYRCESVRRSSLISVTTLALLCLPSAWPQADWSHPLSLGQGEIWTRRIPLQIDNPSAEPLAGRYLAVPAGKSPGQASIEGVRAGELRLVDSEGAELLLAVLDAEGNAITEGPVPQGSTLVIPGECPARSSTTLQLYFGNPSAWETPDFLPNAASQEFNGGFERGTKDLPTGWPAKETDGAHRVAWDRKGGRSQSSAVRVEVDPGAEPSWAGISHRVDGINPGAKYRLRGWVKATGVDGSAGWFVHAGKPGQGQILNQTLTAGTGTFDWKEVTCEFTAPPEATYFVIGTILRGTGTAWFDDAALDQLDGTPVSVRCGAVETLELRHRGESTAWPAQSGPGRALDIRIANLSPTPLESILVRVAPGGGRPALASDRGARLLFENREQPFLRLGDSLLFEHSTPGRTLDTCRYFESNDAPSRPGRSELRSDAILPSDYAPSESEITPDREAYARLLAGRSNLVKNCGFEEGSPLPTSWEGGLGAKGDPAVYGLDSNGLFGKRCARLQVPADAKSNWRGWRQRVPVRAGRTYLYSVWARCEGVIEGTASLHAHLLDSTGKLVKENAFRSTGTPISGTAGWTLWQGTVLIPADGAQFEIHLTTEAQGTLWHDGVFVGEIVDAFATPSQAKSSGNAPLAAWPVNPLVKVFREDNPPASLPEKASLSLAQCEAEPLQIAVRSAGGKKGVQCEVDPPAGPDSTRLPLPAVAHVGYVPIDYPTNYYQSNTPVWHRKTPTQAARCDGWAGWWPDPLLPGPSFDLESGMTQPLWLTFQATATTLPGLYRTTVRLRHEGQILAEMPVELTVRPFALPPESSFAAIYDLRLGRQWLEPGKLGNSVRKSVMELMKSHRLCPDQPEAEPVFRREGDRVVADFTAYDADASEYFDSLRFPRAYMPRFFYLFGWGHPPKVILGERPYAGEFPYENADRSQLRAEYKRVYQECLRLYWDHVKAKGWSNRLVLYISDEPHFTHESIRRQMVALCEMIHAVDPAIPIYSSTWRHCPDWNRSLNVWGVGHYGCFEVAEMERLKAADSHIWFTTDGQMCTDTPYCAVERLLPHYSFKYGAEAYEFWGVGWLTYDPFRYGWHSFIHQSSEPGREFYVRYPNGDGFLLYPGKPIGVDGPVSSIRFEQAREGVEDYEYLQLLTRLLKQAPADHPARKRAEQALAETANLVEIPNAGGRYSTQILPDPDAVLRVRDQLAEAITALGRK